MSGLLFVQRVRVPRAAVTETHRHLQWVGRDGAEGLVLWAGTLASDGDTFVVREAIIPAQRVIRTAQGIGVVVDGVELHRLNRWLYDQRMTLVAQIHSHPGSAYHSKTDDAYAVATTAGSLSIVVPDFAFGLFDLGRCAVFRLAADGRWTMVNSDDAYALVAIED